MIYCKIDYPCKLCGNKQSWYISPLEEKTISGDYVNSVTKFEITCKKCGQRYLLQFNMSMKKRNKRGNNHGRP